MGMALERDAGAWIGVALGMTEVFPEGSPWNSGTRAGRASIGLARGLALDTVGERDGATVGTGNGATRGTRGGAHGWWDGMTMGISEGVPCGFDGMTMGASEGAPAGELTRVGVEPEESTDGMMVGGVGVLVGTGSGSF
jgi:hypothetical protein